MARLRAVVVALWVGLSAARAFPAPTPPPTHAVVELRPELFGALMRGADYPLQVVDYDGGDAEAVLPAKGLWGLGERGHLRRLKLGLTGPDDIGLRLDSEVTAGGRVRPLARLNLTLRGPAEAEWWGKLPLQGSWGLVHRFSRPIVLTIHARAEFVVSRPPAGNPAVVLAFEPVTGGDVELNVRGCPPWLDRLIETQFEVADQVNTHLATQIGSKARYELPTLTVPYTGKQVIYEDVRPQVRGGVLRVELTVGSR
jgi:hypothetical protein